MKDQIGRGSDNDSDVELDYKLQKDILGSVAVDSVKVRCPNCYQPYKVYASDIREARPKFECRKCDSKFWLPFPEALNRSEQIGFPVSWLNVKADEQAIEHNINVMHSTEDQPFQRTCSNCGSRHAIELKECPYCEAVVEKADAKVADKNEGVKSTPRLRELWQEIVENFEQEDGHDRFLKEAEAEQCMEYAVRRYSELEEAMGPDPLIEKMRSRIQALQVRGPIVNKAPVQSIKPSKSSKFWLGFSNFVLVVASVVCVIGLTLPGGKNMVGVGAAIAFFSLSLRLLQKR